MVQSKQDRSAYVKEWYQQNKEKRAAYNKEYYKNNPKKLTINSWRRLGLVGDLDAIYESYINTTHCDTCNIELCSGQKGSNKKCMDHCHSSGEFRNVLCHNCNCQRQLKSKKNTSGHPNICRSKGGWRFMKEINKKKYYFYSKSKIDVICYKYLFNLKRKAGLI
tara:strand:+ start:93 stop:584 length:492 start_codon:yes stop_codon:yes gene_type:complete